jgi:hypothetical protein
MKLVQMFLSAMVVLLMPLLAQSVSNTTNPDSFKGDFFIVSSIDLAKKQILLKRPTEVTELMLVDAETRYFEEQGRTIGLTGLRAGDTVFITSRPKAAQSTAISIRKGPMTLDVLRERYLKRAK